MDNSIQKPPFLLETQGFWAISQKPFEILDFEGGFCRPVHLAHNDILYIRVIIWGDLGPGSKRMISTPPEAEFHGDSKSGSPTFVG